MTVHRLASLLIATLIIPVVPAAAQEEDAPVHAKIQVPGGSVSPGETFDIEIVLDIAPGYHLYGKGTPEGYIQLGLRPDEEKNPHIKIGEVSFPEPEKKVYEDIQETHFIYEGRITASAKAEASDDLPGDEVTITFILDYQACTDLQCDPPMKDVALRGTIPIKPRGAVTAEVTISQDRIRPGDEFEVIVILEIEEGKHLYGKGTPAGYIQVSLGPDEEKNAHIEIGEFTFPEPVKKVDEVLEETHFIYKGKIEARAKAKASEDLSGDKVTIHVLLDYQSCTENQCDPPKKDVPASASFPVAGGGEEIIVAKDGGSGEYEQAVEERGFLVALLLAFLAGLAASISPCVYPMIPITVAYFGGQAEKGQSMRFLATVYVLGVCSTFTIVGLVVGFGGGKIQMGALLQNTWVLIGLATLFFALALSMFGLYEIRLPSSLQNRLGGGGAKQGVIGAFSMGAVLGLVAAPCVGPFLAAILLFVATTAQSGATTTAAVQGGTTLFVFGLGLGIPFLILAMFAGKAMSMPRAGPWMDKIKSFFGLVMIGVSLYFVSLIQGVSPTVTSLLYGALLVVTGVFLGPLRRSEKEDGWPAILVKSAGLLAIFLGGYLFIGAVAQVGVLPQPGTGSAGSHAGHGHDAAGATWVQPTTLEEYDAILARAKEEGKPVVIDFWATWCIPCKQLEKKVLKDPEVDEVLGARFVTIKVDNTSDDSPLTLMRVERYKAFNIPFLTFFDSQGNHLPDKSVGKVDKEEFLEILSTIE